MSSSNKTPLGLNIWAGTDKPKREDFNEDNQIIDAEISAIIGQNLLINSSLIIWQRGTSFTNPNNAYTADRMKCTGTGTILAVGGANPTGGMILTGSIAISYIMENVDFAAINGKSLTLSYNFNGAVTTNTFIADSTTCPVDGGGRRVLNITPGAGTLTWIKLEVGDKATPFSARNIAEERLLCLRYYQRFGGENIWEFYGIGAARDATMVDIIWIFEVGMRTIPTVTQSAANSFYISAAGSVKIPTSINSAYKTSKNAQFMLGGMTGLTPGAAVRVMANDTLNAFIALDAEL